MNFYITAQTDCDECAGTGMIFSQPVWGAQSHNMRKEDDTVVVEIERPSIEICPRCAGTGAEVRMVSLTDALRELGVEVPDVAD